MGIEYSDEVRYMDEVGVVSARPTTSTTIGWAAVFSGAVIGLGVGLLGSMLFLGWPSIPGRQSFGTTCVVARGTTIVATFLGAFIAGLLAGPRGFGAGLAHGMTLWGVLVVGLLASAIPILERVRDDVPCGHRDHDLFGDIGELLVGVLDAADRTRRRGHRGMWRCPAPFRSTGRHGTSVCRTGSRSRDDHTIGAAARARADPRGGPQRQDLMRRRRWFSH